MINLISKYKILIDEVKSISPFTPEYALILGSGLGDFAHTINCLKSIENSTLPDYPISAVEGHKGFIHFAEHNRKNILIFQGRTHFYETNNLEKCIIPVLISYGLGCSKLILTNAAGCINSNYSPGDLILLTGFNSLFIKKELSRIINYKNYDNLNIKLNLPSKELNEQIIQAAINEKIFLREGKYWYTKGPSYETPAEIRMMLNLGYDAVGMSTVYEAVLAASVGMKVSAISCLTNYAAGISKEKLSHQEVIDTADKVKSKFERLIKGIFQCQFLY